jgi:hypothetical protein
MMETTKVIPENGELKTWIEIRLKFQIEFLIQKLNLKA